MKLLKFPCGFEFSIALCFLRENHILFEMRHPFAEPLSIKKSSLSTKIFLVMFSSIISSRMYWRYCLCSHYQVKNISQNLGLFTVSWFNELNRRKSQTRLYILMYLKETVPSQVIVVRDMVQVLNFCFQKPS